MGQREPRALSEVLGQVLGALSAERRAAFLLQPAWARVVGPSLAAHAVAQTLEGRRLVVRCDSAALAQTLAARADVLRRALNETLAGESIAVLEVRGP